MIELTLPWPPSINHYYGNGRNGRKFIKPAGTKFRLDVDWLVAGKKLLQERGRLALFIHAYPPDKRARDLDNICKALQDALQHAGCYENDSQIDGLRVIREAPVKGGKVFVRICQHRTGESI